MSQKNKYRTGVYAFLAESGILHSGDEQIIAQAKRTYWLEYKKQWNKEKRAENKSISVFFTEKELQGVRQKAKEYNTNATAFIKRAALATVTKAAMNNPVVVGEIRQLFVLYTCDIDNVLTKSNIPLKLGQEIGQKMDMLQYRVLEAMRTYRTAAPACPKDI